MCRQLKRLKAVDRVFVRHFTCLCIASLCVIIPINFLLQRHSLHYLLSENKVSQGDLMREENNKRIEEANAFLKKVINARTLHDPIVGHETMNNLDVGITIITVSRNRHRLDNYEPKYLTQVVAKFMKVLDETSAIKHKYKLFLCDVDPNSSSYDEIKPLSKLVPTFQRFRSDLDMVWSTMSISERLEKEKKDYVFCARETLNMNVSNILLVEDDALPHDDLLPVLDRVITNILDEKKSDHKHEKNVTYIKFYHPDHLLGYISLEPERIPELFCLSFLMSAVMMFCYRKYRPITSSYARVLWFYFLAYSCALLLLIGRQNLLELRRMSIQLYQVTRAPACCTPAMLYPSNKMQEVLHYLSSVRCKENFGKDYALEKFRTTFKKTGLMVQPNLFTHIGMYSSLRNRVLDPMV